ncbi:MAG: hypothetical protein ACRDKL_03215, partial [Solirubrobacteraceae bacterium]
MSRLTILGRIVRTGLPRTRSSALVAVAMLAGGVLGPLAGIAVGHGRGKVTVITVPPGCTVAGTTSTTTSAPTGTGTTTTTPPTTTPTTTTTTGTTTTGTAATTVPATNPTSVTY